MRPKKRGLGKGLNKLGVAALLNDIDTTVQAAATATPAPSTAPPRQDESALKQIGVDLIERSPYQPRRAFKQAALDELAQSIKSQGIIQPIVVRAISRGRYELVAGERRWRAAQLAGLTAVPAVVKPICDQAAMAMALIENIQRQALNSIEEAGALQRLIDEFQMTHQEVADAVGKSRTAVSNLLRLLNLAAEVKQMLIDGQLEMGHARALLSLDAHQQIQVAHQVKNLGLSVRQTEAMIKRMGSPQQNAAAKPVKDPDMARLERDLSDKLHAKVQIQHSAKGSGKVVIHYHSNEELDGLLTRF